MHQPDSKPHSHKAHVQQLSEKAWQLLCDRAYPDIEQVRALIAQGADVVRARHRLFGSNLWHDVAKIGHPNAVAFALTLELDINQRSTSDFTPLHRLVYDESRHKAECIRLMAAGGANVDARGMASGSTPLQVLCANGSLDFEAAFALLEVGAPLDDFSRSKLDDWEEDLELNHSWWHPFAAVWQQAEAFAASPDISQLTPQLVCALSNLGKVDAICDMALWRGHEAELIGLLTQLPPWLAERIVCEPAIAECVRVAYAPDIPRPQIKSPVDSIGSLRQGWER